jgi:hypothetical protein
MDSSKVYKEKSTGKYLGRFLFAAPNNPEGAGRGRYGTFFYFMPNNSQSWNFKVGVIREYTENYDVKTPPIPADIEETTQSGGNRRRRKTVRRKTLRRKH